MMSGGLSDVENQVSLDHKPLPFFYETERARRAQQSWAELPLRARLECTRGFRHALADATRRVCSVVAAELGKHYDEILVGDILPVVEQCRFLELHARRILRPRRTSLLTRPVILWGQRDWTYRRPRGVVGVIGTWNLPLSINAVPIMHALVAGNGVLFKPSELAPKTGELLADLIAQAGFPADIFQLLPAHRDAGPQLAEADIDHIAFTGSSTTGRALAATLGRRLVTSTLELSGCDSLVLLDDGDVSLAARGAWFGATANLGQACVATRRAFVPRTLLDEFLGILGPLVEQASPVTLLLPAQVELAERLVTDAQERGARLIRRDSVSPTNGLVQPAALIQSSPDTLACQEAFFVPLLTVIPYDSIDQAIAWNAQCPYFLGASVFTRDIEKALALSGKLRSGVVHVNDVILPMAQPATCFGGRGASGWGRTKGVEGLLDMTVPQVVSAVSGRSRPHFDAPGTFWLFDPIAFEALIRLRHARSLCGKLRGARRLIGKLLSPYQAGRSDCFGDED